MTASTSQMASQLTVLARYEDLARALRSATALAARRPQYAGRLAILFDDQMPGGGTYYAVVTPGRQKSGYALNGQLRAAR